MKVICVSGHAQNGKDTSAEILRRVLSKNGFRSIVVHYADMLKFICKNFFGWDGEKDERGRALLQYVGTEVFRAEDKDYWVNLMLSVLRAVKDADIWDYVIIADCRFPNEIERVRESFPSVHVRVERTGFLSPLTPEQQSHPSETSLDGYPSDYTLHNSGSLLDLYAAVERLAKEL